MSTSDLLYHYTTATGLLGILRSGKLWATDRRFLNDLSEAEHGAPLIAQLDASARALADELPHTNVDGLLDRFSQVLSTWHALARDSAWYVASFCETGNLLSQWIGYGHEASYSIGFTAEQLNDMDVWRLRRITYDPDKQLHSLLNDLVTPGLKGLVGAPDEEARDGIEELVAKVLWEMISFKHKAFESEREWRLCSFGDGGGSKVHCRADQRLGLVPYRKIRIRHGSSSLIKKIWIGPTVLGDESVDAVHTNLQASTLSGIEVEKSSIPYRW